MSLDSPASAHFSVHKIPNTIHILCDRLFFLIFSSIHVTLFKYFPQRCLLAGLYWGWGGWGERERESEVGRERVEIIAMMTSPTGILM